MNVETSNQALDEPAKRKNEKKSNFFIYHAVDISSSSHHAALSCNAIDSHVAGSSDVGFSGIKYPPNRKFFSKNITSQTQFSEQFTEGVMNLVVGQMIVDHQTSMFARDLIDATNRNS
jgi:hypothetical protein